MVNLENITNLNYDNIDETITFFELFLTLCAAQRGSVGVHTMLFSPIILCYFNNKLNVLHYYLEIKPLQTKEVRKRKYYFDITDGELKEDKITLSHNELW